MKTYDNNFQADHYLRITDLSRELEYRSSNVLRNELVAKHVLQHNKNKRCYEFTQEAISVGLGETRYAPKYGGSYPYNIFFVEKVKDFLESGCSL